MNSEMSCGAYSLSTEDLLTTGILPLLLVCAVLYTQEEVTWWITASMYCPRVKAPSLELLHSSQKLLADLTGELANILIKRYPSGFVQLQ